MKVAGIDMGSVSAKVVILEDSSVLFHCTLVATEEGSVQTQKALGEALTGAGVSAEDIRYVVATGSGRHWVPFAQDQAALAICLGKGANWLRPSVRTVIDVGAENCVVVKIDDAGEVEDTAANDRCASGTGVFLETVANLMEMPVEEMARLSLQAKGRADISSMCTIFAEQEIISYIHGVPPMPLNDVIAGVHASLAARITGLAKTVGIKPDVMVCGGVARNEALIEILKEMVGVGLQVPEEPQTVPALGAACLAQEAISQ